MAKYLIDITHTHEYLVEAGNAEEATKIAQMEFEKGNRGKIDSVIVSTDYVNEDDLNTIEKFGNNILS